jgi:hypothetical protein
VQPNNNRPPGEAEEPVSDDALDSAFTTGDSFANDPSDQGGAGELPSWLQDFADVAGDAGGDGQPAVAAVANEPPTPQPNAAPTPAPDTILPPAAPESQPSMPSIDAFSQAPVGGDTSFFSEDDLPEWLRALNTESDQAPVTASAIAMPVTSPAPNGTLQVPPVSRAWVTASDQPEVSPSANLMSSLVNVIDSRPDAVVADPAVAAPAAPPRASVSAAPKATSAAAPASVAVGDEKRANRTRMLLIATIIVLVLIIIVMQLGN